LSSADREKLVVVLIRRAPLGSERVAEALRVAVGQTLASQRVAVIFIDDGVWAATALNPNAVRGGDFAKPIQTLTMLEQRLIADADSMVQRGIQEGVSGVEVRPRNEVFDLVAEADAVIAY
jgi:sulfur relay (sulfurtransferase) DsrF/TusC family protein